MSSLRTTTCGALIVPSDFAQIKKWRFKWRNVDHFLSPQRMEKSTAAPFQTATIISAARCTWVALTTWPLRSSARRARSTTMWQSSVTSRWQFCTAIEFVRYNFISYLKFIMSSSFTQTLPLIARTTCGRRAGSCATARTRMTGATWISRKIARHITRAATTSTTATTSAHQVVSVVLTSVKHWAVTGVQLFLTSDWCDNTVCGVQKPSIGYRYSSLVDKLSFVIWPGC